MNTDKTIINFKGMWKCLEDNSLLQIRDNPIEDYNFHFKSNKKEWSEYKVYIRRTNKSHATFIGSIFFENYCEISIKNPSTFSLIKQNKLLTFTKIGT